MRRSIKSVICALLTAAVICGLPGCENDRRRELESARRREAEARKKAESSRNRWQVFAVAVGCAGGLLLVVGAGIGSAGRKAAENERRGGGGL